MWLMFEHFRTMWGHSGIPHGLPLPKGLFLLPPAQPFPDGSKSHLTQGPPHTGHWHFPACPPPFPLLPRAFLSSHEGSLGEAAWGQFPAPPGASVATSLGDSL